MQKLLKFPHQIDAVNWYHIEVYQVQICLCLEKTLEVRPGIPRRGSSCCPQPRWEGLAWTWGHASQNRLCGSAGEHHQLHTCFYESFRKFVENGRKTCLFWCKEIGNPYIQEVFKKFLGKICIMKKKDVWVSRVFLDQNKPIFCLSVNFL